MFDTHCHLNSSRFKKNLVEVVEEAGTVGVREIMVPGTSLKDSKLALEIANKFERVWAAVGIHPGADETMDTNELKEEMIELLSDKKVRAIGEVGLDAQYLDKVSREVQMRRLVEWLKLAKEFDKAVIVHGRGMVGELLTVLKENWTERWERRMVFHCCEADERLWRFASERGIFMGVDGDVTYPSTSLRLQGRSDSRNSGQAPSIRQLTDSGQASAREEDLTEKQKWVKKIPLELLVLETDAPYLLPEPLRSERRYPNVPGNLPLVLERVVELLGGVEVGVVEETTTENARRLFGLG